MRLLLIPMPGGCRRHHRHCPPSFSSSGFFSRSHQSSRQSSQMLLLSRQLLTRQLLTRQLLTITMFFCCFFLHCPFGVDAIATSVIAASAAPSTATASIAALIAVASADLHRRRPPRHAMNCDLAQAESCFGQLFDQLPICSAMDHTGELAFRCQHFNVLDICFGDNQIRCLPAAIGTAARTAYQKRVDGCLFANKAEQQLEQQQPQKQQQTRSHLHGRGEPVGLLAPPSELQFISLFGYLQTQCRPRRRSPSASASSSAVGMDSGGGERASARRAHLRASEPGGGGTSSAAAGANCSAVYTDEVLEACEEEMKKRQPQPFLQLERHRLLRLKLDASSKLLHFPETRPEDECLMVRSVLSDIFLIHHKFCFHTTVTRCLCERMHFERSCGIQCSNLEAYGLPLNRQLMWTDFRGRLSAADGRPMGGQRHFLLLLIVTMLALMLPSWMASGGGWRR